MNRPGWRRVGAVLRCRLDVQLAVGREVRRQEPDQGPQTLSPQEVIDLFGLPDLPTAVEEMAQALLPGSFQE